MKPCKDTPCSQCPMRRKSMPGWLGADVPESFIQTVHRADEMPCHVSVNYENPEWRDQLQPGDEGSATACAGVAIYHANILKRPRDRNVRTLDPDKVNVFASPTEFIAHHRSSGVVSGELFVRKELFKRAPAVPTKARARRR